MVSTGSLFPARLFGGALELLEGIGRTANEQAPQESLHQLAAPSRREAEVSVESDPGPLHSQRRHDDDLVIHHA